MNRYFALLVILTASLWLNNAIALNSINIHVSGVSDDARKNILEKLRVVQEAYGKKLSAEEIDDFYQNAPANIQKALEPFGYFKAKVIAHLEENNSVWTASFNIQPGPQIKISAIDVQIIGPGQHDAVLQNTIHALPIKPGDTFQTANYEKAKNMLFQTAHNQGYIKAFFAKKEIRIDLPNDRTTVTLYLDTGPRYYLGVVTFEKNPFDTKFLKRFIPFHRDDPYSSQKLYRFQQALTNSQYFQEVVVTPDLKHVKNYYVPIQVSLTAPKSKRLSFGVGYGTVTGGRFTTKADFRRITNTGHHFTTELNVTSVLRALTAKYYIPGKKPLTDQYTIGGNIQRFMPKNGTSFSESLSLGFQKKHKVWRRDISLNFLNEQYTIFGQQANHSQLLYPSFTIARVKADNLLHPRNGSSISLKIQGGSKQIISATNFLQGEIKGKYIFSPYDAGRFILRGDVGTTVVDNLNHLPLTMQYFAGGIESIRGYPESEFGPGRNLAVASIEYQHRIIGDWSGAVFYDTGGVFNRTWTANTNIGSSLNTGDGFGIIYHSFVGPMRLYFEHAENRKGKPWSVEFSIGADL